MWSCRCWRSLRPAASSGRRSSAPMPDDDRNSRALGGGLSRGVHDLEHVQVVRRVGEGSPLLPQGKHDLAQSVSPQPGRVDCLVLLPAALLVAPDLEAARVPVVSEQVRRPLGPVELEAGPPVALDRLAGDDRGEGAGLMAKQDVRNVWIEACQGRRPPPRAAPPPSPPSRSTSATGPRIAVRLFRL